MVGVEAVPCSSEHSESKMRNIKEKLLWVCLSYALFVHLPSHWSLEFPPQFDLVEGTVAQVSEVFVVLFLWERVYLLK